MKRLLAFAIAALLALLYVLIPDPFGAHLHPAAPPRLEEAPPPPDDDPPTRARRPATPEPAPPEAASLAPAAPARLTGRVTDLLGGGIRGARVALHRETDDLAAGNTLYALLRRVVPPETPLYTAETDADGAFTLPPPGAGRYRVETTARDRAIDVLAGVELTEEEPGGEFEIRLAPGDPLAGRLVGAGGGTVAGGVILARAEATAAEPTLELTAATDRFGRFRFPSLPTGRTWRLLVRAEGWVATGFGDVRLPQSNLELLLDRGRDYRLAVAKAGLLEPLFASVLVRDGDHPIAAGETDSSGVFTFRGAAAREVTIHVQPADYEAGLYRERLGADEGDLGTRLLAVGRPVVGVVMDVDSGRGLADADVRADHIAHAGILPPRWLRTGRHGEFVFAGYGGDGLALAAFRDGHAASGAEDEVRLEGWPAGDVRLTLRRLGSVRGRVVGPRGTAAAGVELRAILPGQGAISRVTSGADGGFTMPGLPVQRPLRVVGWSQGLGYGVSASLRIENALEPGRVNVRLAVASRLRGFVADASGTPVAEARVRVETVEAEPLLVAEVVAGADGRFRVDGLAPGRFRLVAERAGHARAEIEVLYAGGTHPEVEMTAPRLLDLVGTVYGAGRRPAPRVVVEARRIGQGEVVGWGLTGQDGGFRLAGPGPGEYTLWAVAMDGSSATTRWRAGAGHAVLVLGATGSAPVKER